MKRIKIHDINATDCPISIDNVQFGIDTRAWEMITLIHLNKLDDLLTYIKDNFGEDRIKQNYYE